MPTISVQGQTITCESGANLRQVLLKHGVALYNGKAKVINCLGLGSCGTCAVEIEGAVTDPNWKEKARLSLPPHSPTKKRRLACQIRVTGDIQVKKYNGFWGQGEDLVWKSEY
ncbi:2Fe-2S iron-sulfur cluster-binding protein [Gloeothece verrucosa]|uniref:Ferredoxin n=1 Tax=Gloeothece verrucosa (strain PCC 7822) TaxID=497965 RepID=E0UB28_GLOV7|nr:2Fe-2S iron-sulfur cluster-binding protein [Gloeothece verrucosa]ADN16273.1 ferredoxin [Gloeothece verrucosa PCC 7822]